MKDFLRMPQMPPNVIKFFVGVLVAGAAIYGSFRLYNASGNANHSSAFTDLASVETKRSLSNERATEESRLNKSRGAERPVNSKTTYRPQVARPLKQFTGARDPSGSVDVQTPGWWLYANSQAEAEWLDYFGYPTPSEEISLAKMSDQELAVLVADGDSNAASHQAARAVSEFFKQENIEKSRLANGLQNKLLLEGGPYQAFTIYREYGELLQAFQDLPASEQTPKRRAILEGYGRTAQLAFDIGSAYDDRTILALNNGLIYGLKANTGFAQDEARSSSSLARTLAGMAARRREMNMPAIVLNPRPLTPRNVAFVPLERY
jgi:hypothetical protein